MEKQKARIMERQDLDELLAEPIDESTQLRAMLFKAVATAKGKAK